MVAAADAKTVWNMNIWGAKRAFTAGIEKIKELAEKDAPGEFELNIQYGDALGNRKQNPENIKTGVFEMGQICVGYYPNKYPLLGVMELPFLAPRDLETRAKVEMEVLAHPAILAELKDRWNSIPVGPAFLPAYEFMGNKRIETEADMKGVKMRISGLNATALEVFGAVPTMVTAPEGYEALRRGTIDSFGFPYTYAFGAYKLYEVSKYVTEGLGMSGFMCLQTLNIDAFNATPKIIRDNIPKYQAAAIEAMLIAYRKADKKWRPIFDKKLEIVKVDPAVRAKLAEGAEAIWEKWVKKQEAAGRPGREMLDFVIASVKKHSG
jgi:TRAP-type C4-dicarboxylate transport system substrate-binding protein